MYNVYNVAHQRSPSCLMIIRETIHEEAERRDNVNGKMYALSNESSLFRMRCWFIHFFFCSTIEEKYFGNEQIDDGQQFIPQQIDLDQKLYDA